MFTKKMSEFIVKDCPDVVAFYKFFNKETGLNYDFSRFIDEFYIIKEKYRDIYDNYCRMSVEEEDRRKTEYEDDYYWNRR